MVIVAFRNASDVLSCLAALEKQTRRDFNIVICENGTHADHAGLQAALAGRPDDSLDLVLIHAPENPGYAGGINRAIAAAPTAQAYWILNPDTIPDAEALACLCLRLDEGDCDAVGGVVYLPDGKVRSCGGNWSRWTGFVRGIGLGRELSDRPSRAEVEPRLSFISGACILTTAKFLTSNGLMREDYFLYAEEVEWCLRARSLGLSLGYCPDALICHYQGSTTGSQTDTARRPALPIYLDERNRLLVVRDTFAPGLITAVPCSLMLLTLRYLLRGNLAQWRIALSGWWAGVIGQRGKWFP